VGRGVWFSWVLGDGWFGWVWFGRGGGVEGESERAARVLGVGGMYGVKIEGVLIKDS